VALRRRRPEGFLRWSDGATRTGAFVRVAAFQQRFSVAVGTDSFSGRNRDAFFTIGVSDLNGAPFWLLGH
jgi:hypothetical protein